MRKKTFLSVFALMIGAGSIFVNSCVHPPYVMPDTQRTNDPDICFGRDILPIFVSQCAKSGCHDAVSHEKGYVLDNYQNIMKKGIVPGNIAASKIWESVVGGGSGEDDEKMPKDAPPLTATQLDLLKRWISAGAVDGGSCTSSCDSNNYTFSGAILPLMNQYCTGCHNSATAPGGSLKDYNSIKTAAVSGTMIGNITHQAGYKVMPPGIQLSDCEVTQIKRWVAAGAPNN